MRKAIIETGTGLVVNVIEIEPDDSGNFGHWQPPHGCQMIDDGPNAQPGATWNGSKFTLPDPYVPTRLEVLMDENRVFSDRPADDIVADKTELLEILHTRLADTGDLTGKEMNKMLALERES